MLLALDEWISIPVDLVVIGAGPIALRGTLAKVLPDRVKVAVGVPVRIDARVILSLPDGHRIAGRVLGVNDEFLEISRDHARIAEDRSAPRVKAQLALRWRLLGGDPTFRIALPQGDMSITGLRFEVDPPGPAVGDTLVVEINGVHEAQATVRRVETGPGTLTIAVELIETSEEILQALGDLTLADSEGT